MICSSINGCNGQSALQLRLTMSFALSGLQTPIDSKPPCQSNHLAWRSHRCHRRVEGNYLLTRLLSNSSTFTLHRIVQRVFMQEAQRQDITFTTVEHTHTPHTQ
eukprot:6200747-Pleurochrysis_carterae.AAC.1